MEMSGQFYALAILLKGKHSSLFSSPISGLGNGDRCSEEHFRFVKAVKDSL
jgi:hypothetical protein